MTNQAYMRLYCAIREHIAELRGPRLACLLAIATRANADGEAWPSVTRLSEDTGYSRRLVIAAVRWLGHNGWIKADSKHGKVTHYTIMAPQIGTGYVKSPVERTASDEKSPVQTPTGYEKSPPLVTKSNRTGYEKSPEVGTTEEGTTEEERGEPRPRARATKANPEDPWLTLAREFRKLWPSDKQGRPSTTAQSMREEYEADYRPAQVFDRMMEHKKRGTPELKPWELFSKRPKGPPKVKLPDVGEGMTQQEFFGKHGKVAKAMPGAE